MKFKEQLVKLGEKITAQDRKIDELVEMIGMVVSELPRKQAEQVKVDVTLEEDGHKVGQVTKTVSLPPEVGSGLPPPSRWRAKVSEILGEDFELKVEESSGGNYIMVVTLPVIYDRRVGEKHGRDVSTGLVRRASDLADVERWSILIRDNIRKTYPNFKK